MGVDHLKALLAILTEELTGDHEGVDFVIDDKIIRELQHFKKFSRKRDSEQLEDSIRKLISKSKTSSVINNVDRIVLEALVMIFVNSSQMERQAHFEELIGNFFKNLSEKLHQEGMLSSIYSEAEYKKKINEYIPLAKLITVHKLYKTEEGENNRSTLVETALEELFEVITCPNILREDCFEIVTEKLETDDYKILEYSLASTGERKGQLGDYNKLKISVEHNEKNLTLYFFAKFFPSSDYRRDLALQIYKKEEFFYNRFIPILKQLGLGSSMNFAADLFLIRTNDCIILEDLSELQYASIDLLVPFDYNTLAAVVKNLAELHSCSLVFEEKLGKLLGKTVRIGDYYQHYLSEIMYNPEVPVVHSTLEITLNFFLEKYSDIVKDLTMDQFKEKVKCSFNNVFRDVRRSNKYRNVMNHGDLWGNNILLRSHSENKSTSSRLVDYQLIRYCPPAIDILFIMHTNTDKSTRDEYSAKLLEEYHSEMKCILEKHGVNIDEIYPYETFMECVKEMKSTAICMSLLYNQLWLMPEDVISDIVGDEVKSKEYFDGDRSEYFEKNFDFAPRKRIRENIEELYEICSKHFEESTARE